MSNQITREQLNSQQNSAVDAAVEWYKGYKRGQHEKQDFFMSGFAGTGKTTVARIIADLCAPPNKVVYIAPTGKAASRLRQKGCDYAKTMHQFIYNVRGEDDDGDPIFVAKGALEESPSLIVLDECRMVGERDAVRLMSHNIPVLALGDIGQLDPVRDHPYFTEFGIDFQLTDIERNQGNIVRASMFVREGKFLPYREYDDVRVRKGSPPIADLLEHSGEESVILCSRNDTRNELNLKIRKALGFEGELPQIGEKLMCTFNQHGHNFMNGEQCILLEYSDIPDYEREDDEGQETMKIRIKSLTTMKEKWVKFNTMSFLGDKAQREEARKGVGGFDWGWVLTIHKSQGSEWLRVLLIEENMPYAPYAKLMYTGITRAIERLTLYR